MTAKEKTAYCRGLAVQRDRLAAQLPTRAERHQARVAAIGLIQLAKWHQSHA